MGVAMPERLREQMSGHCVKCVAWFVHGEWWAVMYDDENHEEVVAPDRQPILSPPCPN